MQDLRTYVIYKPYGMLSQFTREIESHVTLADLNFEFKKDVYPVGRLDADSEGLLVLTNNKLLNQKLLNPKAKQQKTYWAQVEGIPKDSDLSPLRKGVEIKIKKNYYTTLPAEVKVLPEETNKHLPERTPPIRYRANIPTTWVELKINEGKNRQVRKMFAKVGFPVLRLVRVGVGKLFLTQTPLEKLQVGEVKLINDEEIL